MKQPGRLEPRPRRALVPLLASGSPRSAAAVAPRPGRRPSGNAQAFGLTNAVVLVDPPAHRVVALGVDADGRAHARRRCRRATTSSRRPSGRRAASCTCCRRGHRGGLGDPQPDEAPRLTIVDGTTTPATSHDIQLDVLSDPLDGLAIDPDRALGRRVRRVGDGHGLRHEPQRARHRRPVDAAAQPPQRGRAAQLRRPPGEAHLRARAVAARGPAHLLVVQSDQDLSLLSLDDPTKPDITVRLADADGRHAAAPGRGRLRRRRSREERRRAHRHPLRRADERHDAAARSPRRARTASRPTINVADVGGVPSAIAFVRTDGGLRLSALVPDARRGRARRPGDDDDLRGGAARRLPQPLARDGAGGRARRARAAGPDVALLWNGTSSLAGVAFWELGRAAGLPFRSIETVGIDGVVSARRRRARPERRAQGAEHVGDAGSGGTFFVLDLGARTATPLLTATHRRRRSRSRPRARASGRSSRAGSSSRRPTCRPGTSTRCTSTRPRARSSRSRAPTAGTRSSCSTRAAGVGATVFDADDPNEAERRIYGALLTEGPYDDQ